MALTSPDSWQRFNRVNVSLDAVTQMPGISAPSAAFGEDLAEAPEAERGLFVSGGRGRVRDDSPSAARDVVAGLGLGSEASTRPRRLRTASVLHSRAGTHVVLQQRIGEADVVGANMKVHFDPSGGFAVTGRPIGDLEAREPAGPPQASSGECARAAAEALGVDPATAVDRELVVFPLADGRGVWAWRITFVLDDPIADVRAFVDATSLALLLSFNIASAVRGRANVYPVNPTRTPNLREVSLGDLGAQAAGALASTRVVVTPFGRPPTSRPDLDFRFADTEDGFDEANAYYHLRRGLLNFGRLHGRRRFASPPFRPIRAVVRDASSPNNAYYRPTAGDLRFGDILGRPTARSADIIYHELGHAVSDVIARMGRAPSDSPSRGLSEGYSDYFANSALDDPRFGDYVAPNRMRDSSNRTLRFQPGFAGPEHATGAVWAACLWSIRERLGREATDRIAFGSMFFLGPSSSFADAFSALLAANQQRGTAASGTGGADTTAALSTITEEWHHRLPA